MPAREPEEDILTGAAGEGEDLGGEDIGGDEDEAILGDEDLDEER
jgi:hypothetical protein